MVAGRFGIVRFIARGGMGAVYEAEDVTLRTRVALKTILPEFAADPNAMERFRREVLLARRITHFNVCRIFELYDTFDPAGDRLSFLTMELLHGETLAERLARTGPLATAELSVLLRQLADGLEAMHLQDVVHRDFKPANVFLVHRHDAAGHAPLRAVITDFGIARALHRAERDGDSSMTARVGFIGTPAYMAPEQLTGGTISPATDIYALGIVLYEALTGHTPFGGQTPMEAALKRLQQAAGPPSVFLPTLEPRWDAAVLRCLEKEPSARFRSVRDLVRALDATAQDSRSSAAVLGFRNLSGRPDAGWISTALADLVGRELSSASDVLRLVPAGGGLPGPARAEPRGPGQPSARVAREAPRLGRRAVGGARELPLRRPRLGQPAPGGRPGAGHRVREGGLQLDRAGHGGRARGDGRPRRGGGAPDARRRGSDLGLSGEEPLPLRSLRQLGGERGEQLPGSVGVPGGPLHQRAGHRAQRQGQRLLGPLQIVLHQRAPPEDRRLDHRRGARRRAALRRGGLHRNRPRGRAAGHR